MVGLGGQGFLSTQAVILGSKRPPGRGICGGSSVCEREVGGAVLPILPTFALLVRSCTHPSLSPPPRAIAKIIPGVEGRGEGRLVGGR